MTREELYGLLEKGPVFLDGATGSNLQKAGMPTGVCPEQWILDHPDVIVDLQKRYIEAGTQILYAPTFSGNRIKLEEYGLADKIVEINTKLVQLCPLHLCSVCQFILTDSLFFNHFIQLDPDAAIIQIVHLPLPSTTILL